MVSTYDSRRKKSMVYEAMGLLSYRLSYAQYPFARALDVKGRWTRVSACTARITKEVAALFTALSLRNTQKKRRRLREICWWHLPPPFRQLLATRYGTSLCEVLHGHGGPVQPPPPEWASKAVLRMGAPQAPPEVCEVESDDEAWGSWTAPTATAPRPSGRPPSSTPGTSSGLQR
jgi:hypothetical protein